MRIVVHHAKYYDWQPVPEGVEVSKADIAARRVKPDNAGTGYLMRVPVEHPTGTHTEIQAGEHTIIGKIIQAYTENGRQGEILTRRAAVARLLQQNVLPHHTHPKWMQKVEVHDDGPDEKLFRSLIAPHLDADHASAPGKNIEPEDVEDLVKAYLEPVDAAGHVAHLSAHFKVKEATP